MLVDKIGHVCHLLGVVVAEIVKVVCVIWLEVNSSLYVLHVRYVLVIKLLQVVSIF